MASSGCLSERMTSPHVVLERAEVVRLLPASAREALLAGGGRLSYEDGAVLLQAGSGSDHALVLTAGEVVVTREGGGAPPVRLSAPALVGEVAAFTGMPRTATVTAVGRVQATRLERTSFLEAVRRCPPAAQALSELVAARLCDPDSLRQVGRFEVEGMLGRGGSGCVLRARHPLLHIPVALKMLSHALVHSPGAAEAFVREASVLARLEHPGIVRVLDAFEAHDTFFIVMPWLDGTPLRERMDRPADSSSADILRVAREGLEALSALHAAGLVHRDVKPSNLFVRESGQLVLIDLGVCCAAGTRGEGRGLVGSPPYCSPEQVLGRPLDGRSDVYSLGCTLYEWVYGRPPFEGDTVEQVLEGHLRGTPDFARAVPRVDPGPAFLQWLRSCMARTRTARPDAPSALAALRALQRPA